MLKENIIEHKTLKQYDEKRAKQYDESSDLNKGSRERQQEYLLDIFKISKDADSLLIVKQGRVASLSETKALVEFGKHFVEILKK